MKHIQFVSLLALMLLMSNSAMAQLDSKSEFSVSVGVGTPNEKSIGENLGEVFGTALGSAIGTIITFGQVEFTNTNKKEEHAGPAITLQYLYRVAPKLKIGAGLTYQHTSATLKVQDKEGSYHDIAKASNNYFTVVPTAKFMWIEKKHVGLYSKAAAGICIASNSSEFSNGVQVDSSKKDQILDDIKSDKGTRFGYHVSAIGFEAGSKSIRGFAEVGYGFQGFVQAGLTIKL